MGKPKGAKGGGAVAEPEEELDESLGNTGDEPELDNDGNPIEKDEAELDADGNPIEKDEAELDADGNPIVKDEDETDDEDEAEEDPRDAVIADLKERLEKVEKGGAKSEEAKPLTDEDWKKIENEWGLGEKDGMPGTFGRPALQRLFSLFAMSQGRMKEMLSSELGGFKKEAAISELARQKGFEDAKGYRKGMDEFLADYDIKHHSDPKLLKKALIYARGLGAQGRVKKALNNREQSRKINAGGSHGKPGGGNKGGGKPVLTAEQKASAKANNMSEAEYYKYMVTDNLDDIPLPE